MMKILLAFLFLFFSIPVQAEDSLRVMFYNLYRFPVNAPANREYLLQHILKEAHPDLFMACEIVNKDGADRILNTSFNSLEDSFAAAQFIYCANTGDDPLQQMVYFNTRKLTLVHQSLYPTIIRDINHYLFRLNNNDRSGDSVFLDVFVSHLKAGEGGTESWLRGTMADTFMKALQGIRSSHFVLFAGDFNFYDDEEPAFLKLTDTNSSIVMVDPLHQTGDWHENPDFRAIHTQATRNVLDGFGLGGASGGMDDRFDFILMSENLETNAALTYLFGSYQTFGNNGDCYDRAINNDSCSGSYSLPLRNLLFQMSDHAPVIMTLLSSHNFPTKVENSNAIAGGRLFKMNSNIVHAELSLTFNRMNTRLSNGLVVYDLTGRILLKKELRNDQRQLRLNIQDWAPGIYFVRLAHQVERMVKL